MARKKVEFKVNPLFSGPSLAGRVTTGSPYRELLLADIDVDPDQPRRVFDNEALADLAGSIKEYGVLCPILVRLSEGGTYRLVAGERRVRAAKIAGLESIPAVVEANTDSDDRTLFKQLVENVQRQDLTPMERALAIGQLRDAFELSVRDIAKRLGVSKSYVQRSLEVLGLPDDLQAALIAGAAESKVLLLAQLDDRKVRAEFLDRIDSITREELDRQIQQLDGVGEQKSEVSHGGTPRKKKTKLSPQDQRIVGDIRRALGTKVQVARSTTKKGQGKLVIEFYSQDDLNEVYRRLVG